MSSRRADQNRNCFILRPATDRHDGRLLNLSVSIRINCAGQSAKTLLAGDPAQARDRAATQFGLGLVFSYANQVYRSAVAVIIARDSAQRAPLKFARAHG